MISVTSRDGGNHARNIVRSGTLVPMKMEKDDVHPPKKTAAVWEGNKATDEGIRQTGADHTGGR